jgi:hypothetical protein
LLVRLLDANTATADDVRATVKLPPELNPTPFGTVPGQLAEPGIIRPAGFVRTKRPEGHARPVLLWQFADRTAALAWLAENPDLPDLPEPEGASRPVQLSLW